MPEKSKLVKKFEMRRAEIDEEKEAEAKARKDEGAGRRRRETQEVVLRDSIPRRRTVSATIEQTEQYRLATQGRCEIDEAQVDAQEDVARNEVRSIPSPPLTPESPLGDQGIEDISPHTNRPRIGDPAIQKLQAQFEQEQRHRQELEQNLRETRQQVELLMTERDKAEMQEVQAVLAGTPDEAARLGMQVAELARLLRDSKEKKTRLERELEDGKAREHELRMQLLDLTHERTRLENELHRRDSRNGQTRDPQNEDKETTEQNSSRRGKGTVEIKGVMISRPKSGKSFFL
jgi:hypothetical protein